ncbi:MAG: trigger factor [Ruminococcaceae bacterium]|nr:trigger factor [Oscillospiraceae bacterium]
MSLISCTDAGVNRKKLEIEVSAEDFAKACAEAFRKNAHKFAVPGFRKGKAPRGVIEKMYGKEFFYEDAVNDLYPTALQAAIEEGGLEYVDDKIDLDVTSVGEDGLKFTAVITVKPEVELDDYVGIKLTRPSTAVSDEDVDAELNKLLQKNGRIIDIEDRACQNGDTVVFDFEGFVDDVAFDGGKAEQYQLELGSGNFIPGFEDQIVGHSINDEFDVNVTFPEEYHAEELAGKPAVFKCKLHAIKATELPEADDEFIKDYTEFETLEEYKADARQKLEKAAEEKADRAVDDQLFETLTDKLNADIPDAMIENRIDQSIQDFGYRLQMQGISLEDYIKFTGSDMSSVRESMRDQATHQVKVRLALEKIVELEKIEITDEAVVAEYAKLAEQYHMEVDAVKNAIAAKDLRSDLAVDAAVKFVRDNAKIKKTK